MVKCTNINLKKSISIFFQYVKNVLTKKIVMLKGKKFLLFIFLLS